MGESLFSLRTVFSEGLFGLAQKVDSSDDATEYEGEPQKETDEIPCSRRRKRDDSYGAPEANDPCGVFQEADSYVPNGDSSSNQDGKGKGKGKGDKGDQDSNCRWVKATTFKIEP